MSYTVGVIGANGFIGRALTESFAIRRMRVIAATRQPAVFSDPAITNLVSDSRDPDDFTDLCGRCDVLVHAASYSTPGSTAGHPSLELDQNLRTLVALITAMHGHGPGSLIYLSSGGTVYGDSAFARVRESHAPAPRSYYGAAKIAAEAFVTAWSAQTGASATILRPSNVYGPGQRARDGFGIVPTAMGHALRGTTLTIWGDGSTVRDYLHIGDLVELCALTVHGPRTPGCSVINASAGAGVSLNALLDLIEASSGRPLARQHLPGRTVDIRSIVPDPTKARSEWGWIATKPLPAGIRETWQWFAQVA